jgi:hypothetical protein
MTSISIMTTQVTVFIGGMAFFLICSVFICALECECCDYGENVSVDNDKKDEETIISPLASV